MKSETIILTAEERNLRIDSVLAQRFSQHSRAYFQELFEKGLILCKETRVKKRDKLPEGSQIKILFPPLEPMHLLPEPMDLDILFEDDALLAINKPAGIVVHPGAGHAQGTLVAGVLHYLGALPESDDPIRPGVVHRLDKETSGVILIAKTRRAHAALVEAFKNRSIEKTYLAVTCGIPKVSLIDRPIGRHPKRREKMAVCDQGGKNAVTRVTIAHSDKGLSLVYAFPITGRTHQIRVHLQSIGTPVLGDEVYGRKKNQNLPLHLHAWKISLQHPVTKERLTIEAPSPPHFVQWKNRGNL